MTAELLKTKRFLPLLIVQFLGALNDNMFKNALLTLVALKMTELSGVLSNVIAGLFILPFFLFSAMAGEIADKYPRDKIARILKLVELLLMMGVAAAYYWQSLPLLVVLLTLMGAQSAFFGPVKYSLLPQHLQPEELIAGNAYIESTTYLAILLGLVLGTLLPIPLTIGLLITLALVGWVASQKIPASPAPRPALKLHKNILAVSWQNFCFLRKHPAILQSILGATWFWIIGALVAVQIYPLCSQILHTGAGVITFFLILFSIGVAVGSFCCNRLLRGFIHTTYVPLSAVGMAVSLFLLCRYSYNYPTPPAEIGFVDFLTAPHAFAISCNLFLLAFWGGLYIIPLNAFMQNRAPKAYVATVIAGNNIFNALGMAAIAVFAAVFLGVGFSLSYLFLTAGIMTLSVAVYICALLPDAFTRSLVQSLLRFLFRARVEGLENFKKAGKKVLIISNHVSLLDGVLLAAFMPERITFAINTGWTQKWFIPIIRLLVDFYPIDTANPLSLRALIDEIKHGRKVMIFPEGRVTVTGTMMKVYEGAAVIAAKAGAKILPLRINGAQYSKFSYLKGKVKTEWLPQITLNILPAETFAMPDKVAGRHLIAKRLYDLMARNMFDTANIKQTLPAALQHSIVASEAKITAAESGKTFSFAELQKQSRQLCRALQKVAADKQRIGLLLEDKLQNLRLFWALQYLGKTAVILSAENAAAEAEAAGVTLIIGDKPDIKTENITFVAAKDLQRRRLCTLGQPTNADNPALILFDGLRPLVFTSQNLLAAVAQLAIVQPLNKNDICLNGWAPSQAAFWTLALLHPLFAGAEIVLTAATTHAREIAEICYDRQITAVSGNANMLSDWGNTAHPYDFFAANYVVCCDNVAPDSDLCDLWVKKFGLRILSGWLPDSAGCIITLNSRIYNKLQSCGCCLPGIDWDDNSFRGSNFATKTYTPDSLLPHFDAEGFVSFSKKIIDKFCPI